MPANKTILVVEDEKVAGKAIQDHLQQQGFDCVVCESGEEAMARFHDYPVKVVISDIKLPGMSGIDFFRSVQDFNPRIPFIFITAFSSVSDAVELLKMGAFTYLAKPIEMAELEHNIIQALEKISLWEENQHLQQQLTEKFAVDNFVFHTEIMQTLMATVLQAADSMANILISGENGTGKEIIANIIHQASSRKHARLVKLNLAAIPATLLEAELFGAEKGAYTGANATRIGKFEEADGGTLFLDEIGELPPDIQVKLLRVIQEREVTRLGANNVRPVDIRLVTATNRDLEQLVQQKTFREDLYFRLNVINLHVPPLRERREEIELLVHHFLKKFNRREKRQVSGVNPEAMKILMSHDYPGNIRELENIIERAVILGKSNLITVADLPESLQKRPETTVDRDRLPLAERLALVEKEIIIKALEKHNHNQTKTARALGISESGLRYKMQQLGISRD